VCRCVKGHAGSVYENCFLLAETNEYLTTFQQWMNNQMSNSRSIESLVSNFISSTRVGCKSVIKQKCLYEKENKQVCRCVKGHAGSVYENYLQF
jgi:hypothetical protein